KLHHQTASPEESSDDESLRESDGIDAWRSSERFRQLHEPRRRTSHRFQLDFQSRDAFWQWQFCHAQYFWPAARSGHDYSKLHGLAWIELAGFDAGYDSESSTAAGRQSTRSPAGAAQRLLRDGSAHSERSGGRAVAEPAANAERPCDGLQEVP